MEKHGSTLTCVRFNSSGSHIVSSGLDKATVIWETVGIEIDYLIAQYSDK